LEQNIKGEPTYLHLQFTLNITAKMEMLMLMLSDVLLSK